MFSELQDFFARPRPKLLHQELSFVLKAPPDQDLGRVLFSRTTLLASFNVSVFIHV